MIEPWRLSSAFGILGCAAGTQGSENGLRNDGTDLAGGGGEAVRGGAVASWEALAGDDEGRGIGSEVEEELTEDVERK